MTRIVDKLVDGGFVVRRVDATDRRRVLIYLSARGKAKVRKLARQESAVKAALTAELGEDAAVQLIRSLARIGDLSTGIRVAIPTVVQLFTYRTVVKSVGNPARPRSV